MNMLEVKDLTVRYGRLTIVDRLSFSLDEGEWLMLIGPNGAGKSTVVGAVSRAVPSEGKIVCMGQDVRGMRAVELAKRMGVLSQSHNVGYPFTVEEIVRLGRYSHSPSPFAARDAREEACLREALEVTGLSKIAGQSVLTLSGGELQRAFLAQLLAQEPSVLILDEPTNHLDLVYQQQIFELLRGWLSGGSRAILSVVHDLSLARAYGSRALLLERGKMAALGPVEEVFSGPCLDRVYGMDVAGWMRSSLGRWAKEQGSEPPKEEI